MAVAERTVVWIPSGEPGWLLEEARPYDARGVGGGVRTLYEVTAALAASGRTVELRGPYVPAVLDEVCAPAGAFPSLPTEPRAPAEGDTIIVPEGVADPGIHARVVLSPARAVLLLLGPPGLVGWSFGTDWSPPDPLTVEVDAVARGESFRAAAGLGYELWTQTPGIQRAAEAAGVPCRFVGNGVPGGYPPPRHTRDVDVAWLSTNRWAPLARPVVRELAERGIRCHSLADADHDDVLELFGRARIVLHPLRIEGHSRIGCEARAMGAVPVVLSSSPLSVGLDAEGGAVSVDSPDELAPAIADLLNDPDRLASLSATATRTAREQVDWDAFVKKVDAALSDAPAATPVREARAAIGTALRARDAATAVELAARNAELEGLEEELDQHRRWLAGINGSRSWRITAPLRTGKRWLPHKPQVPAPRGRIEWPPSGTQRERAPLDVHGWCLFPGSTVARVEVRLNGGPTALARPAMECLAAVRHDPHPDAPLCAFEHKVDLGDLPAGTHTVEVEAVAVATDGRRFALDPVRYPLTEPAPRRGDPHGVLAELRARSAPAPGPRRLRTGLRLLAFSHTLGHGGGSLYLLELLRRIASRPGVQCEVVALADGPLRESLEAAGIPVHVTDGHPVAAAARYEGHMAELLAWSAPRGYDAVLVNTLGSFAGADLAARLGLPAVWSVHESFTLPMFWFNAFGPGQLHPYVREQAEGALRSAAAVLFVADATRDLFAGELDPRRLLTLPYGIELDAIETARSSLDRAATRRRLGIAPDARVVLCLGSVEPRKSQALLAQAFAQIASRHPDVQLALVGATDAGYCADYRAALRDYVQRGGLGDRVRIERETPDPWSWHAVADLVVCASDLESLPRTVAEALAFETPVLSTRVFGVPELIEDGVHGFLCEMRDVGDMAAALDRVLGTPADELAAVAKRGRERVLARHDPDEYAQRVLRILDGVARDRDALPGDLLAAPEPQPAAAAARVAR